MLFVILLAWIEHRRQRRQGFTDVPPPDRAERDPGAEPNNLPPMFREPTLTLPEMRAAREPGPPQELPVVEIEEDSLNPRRAEPGEPRIEPPTLSLPVMGSGPVAPRARSAEPEVSSFDHAVKPDTPADAPPAAPGERRVPRLDIPARRSIPRQIDNDTAERTFNADVFGDMGQGGDRRQPDFSDEDALEEGAVADAAGVERISAGRRPGPSETRRAAADNEGGTDAEVEDAWRSAGGGSDAAANAAANSSADAHAHAEPEADAETDGDAETDADAEDDVNGEGDINAEGDLKAESDPNAPSAESRFTPADVTPVKDPIVEWPPDDQRRVVALRLVAAPPERLAGRALRLALASEGFVLGKFQIFHKPDESGRAVLSAANLSKPGTFDLENMDSQRYGGVSLFTVLPGPRPALKAFEDLLATARSLNERLQGALQDERGGPLTPTRIANTP